MSIKGFYYCPKNTDGLVTLTDSERTEIFRDHYGAYIITKFEDYQGGERLDLLCALDNSRVPTHREPTATLPDPWYLTGLNVSKETTKKELGMINDESRSDTK